MISDKAGRLALGGLPLVVSLFAGSVIAYLANSSRVFGVCIALAGFGAAALIACAAAAVVLAKWGK